MSLSGFPVVLWYNLTAEVSEVDQEIIHISAGEKLKNVNSC